MGWITVERQNNRGAASRLGGNQVRLKIGRSGKSPKLRITIGAELLAQLKWKRGTRVGLQLGQGPEAAMMRLVPMVTGYALAGKDDGPAAVAMAPWWSPVDTSLVFEGAGRVNAKDQALQFARPDWVKSPQAKPAPAGKAA